MGGHNLPSLVEIGLSWLTKLGKGQSLASLAVVAALLLLSEAVEAMDVTFNQIQGSYVSQKSTFHECTDPVFMS